VNAKALKLLMVVAVSGLAVASTAQAQSQSVTKNLGNGWQVFIPNIDMIDVVRDNNGNSNVIVLEKFAVFESLSALDLVFTQIADNANTYTRLVLTDEYVFNNVTNTPWTGFDISLVDQTGGPATFNQADSASFSISPFTTRAYNGASTQVSFGGGSVGVGTFWTPGVASGALVIDVVLDPNNQIRSQFTLRELPIPGAGSAALAGLAGLVATRRRR
jgi:hypothetical protein